MATLNDIKDEKKYLPGRKPVNIYAKGSPTEKAQSSMGSTIKDIGNESLNLVNRTFGTDHIVGAAKDVGQSIASGAKSVLGDINNTRAITGKDAVTVPNLNMVDTVKEKLAGLQDAVTKYDDAPVPDTPAGLDRMMSNLPETVAAESQSVDPTQSRPFGPRDINDPNDPLTNADIEGPDGLGIGGNGGTMGGYNLDGTRIEPSGQQGDQDALRNPAPTWGDLKKQFDQRQGLVRQSGPKLLTRANSPGMNWQERKSLNEINLKAHYAKDINSTNNKATLENSMLEEAGLNSRANLKDISEKAKAEAAYQRKIMDDNAKLNKGAQPKWIPAKYDKKGEVEKGTGEYSIPKGWMPTWSPSLKAGKGPTEEDLGIMRFMKDTKGHPEFTKALEAIKKQYGI